MNRPDILTRARLAIAALLAILVLFPSGTRAQSPVDLELVLAIDASSSIAGEEFELQINGYAQAFRDPAVIAAITALQPDGIAVTLVQWSASFQQFQSVPWQHVRDAESAERFAAAIEANSRRFVGFGTAIGSAIAYSVGLFDSNGFTGRRRVIDISADERSNMGSHPSYLRKSAVDAGITVNGLAVLEGDDSLPGYFRDFVITGTASFVVSVDSYQNIAQAVRRKLLRELAAPVSWKSRRNEPQAAGPVYSLDPGSQSGYLSPPILAQPAASKAP